ncbi:unnamed protein product [Caenorhabditis nigoni]
MPNAMGFPSLTPGFLPFSILATPLIIQNPPVEPLVAPDDHQKTESSAEDIKEPSRSPEDTECLRRERIKWPLNIFMCFAKEHRQKFWAEPGTSSAEINKILGQKWQELSPEEPKKYVEMAEKEKEEHKVKYPGW